MLLSWCLTFISGKSLWNIFFLLYFYYSRFYSIYIIFLQKIKGKNISIFIACFLYVFYYVYTFYLTFKVKSTAYLNFYERVRVLIMDVINFRRERQRLLKISIWNYRIEKWISKKIGKFGQSKEKHKWALKIKTNWNI